MKRRTFAKTFAIAAAFAFSIAPIAMADDKGCSNSNLRGTFAYTSTGSIATPPATAGPFVEVGTQTFDGHGGTTATAMSSQNGNISPLTVTGTYTLNPDCTGTMTLQVTFREFQRFPSTSTSWSTIAEMNFKPLKQTRAWSSPASDGD